MREIPLTQGKVALVDDSDFEWLSQWKWNAEPHQTKSGIQEIWYAKRLIYTGVHSRSIKVYMHRFLLGISDFRTKVDHRDSDGLNNQRYNLRQSTNSQNSANSRKSLRNTSGFKGVHWYKPCSKWQAQIRCGPRRFHLGYFANKVDAARAYNEAALHYFGDFARLNEI